MKKLFILSAALLIGLGSLIPITAQTTNDEIKTGKLLKRKSEDGVDNYIYATCSFKFGGNGPEVQRLCRNNSETDGERLLLSHGATPDVARVCRSHAQWDTVAETLEELLIALSDKLWKGVRIARLEELVIDRLAQSLQKDRWDCFTELDLLFEEVAATADSRLARTFLS